MDLLLSWRSSRGKNITCTHSLGTEGESCAICRHQSLTSARSSPKVPRLKWFFTSGIRISCMWSKVECMKFGFVPPPLTHAHSSDVHIQTSIHHTRPCTLPPPLELCLPLLWHPAVSHLKPLLHTRIIVTSILP